MRSNGTLMISQCSRRVLSAIRGQGQSKEQWLTSTPELPPRKETVKNLHHLPNWQKPQKRPGQTSLPITRMLLTLLCQVMRKLPWEMPTAPAVAVVHLHRLRVSSHGRPPPLWEPQLVEEGAQQKGPSQQSIRPRLKPSQRPSRSPSPFLVQGECFKLTFGNVTYLGDVLAWMQENSSKAHAWALNEHHLAANKLNKIRRDLGKIGYKAFVAPATPTGKGDGASKGYSGGEAIAVSKALVSRNNSIKIRTGWRAAVVWLDVFKLALITIYLLPTSVPDAAVKNRVRLEEV